MMSSEDEIFLLKCMMQMKLMYSHCSPGCKVEETQRCESNDTGHRSGSLDVDTGQQSWHLTLACPHHEESGGCEQCSIDSSEC